MPHDVLAELAAKHPSSLDDLPNRSLASEQTPLDALTPAEPKRAPPGEWPLIWANKAQARLDEPSLVRGLIMPGSMIVTYGESNSGKTFHVADRDLSLAVGRDYYGRETEQGFVLYVAAEGPHSVERRVNAYLQDKLPDYQDVPFAILPESLDLYRQAADTEPLINFIKRVEDERGMKCVKVTADTLARVMAGGNENSSEDMGALVRNADKVRHDIGCAFELIHHSGKDTLKGARGHSSLRAATDTEIEVTNDNGYHVARVTKQRDFSIGDEFAYRLRVIELGLDNHGHRITTCVPDWETEHRPQSRSQRLKPREQSLLNLMRAFMRQRKTYAPPHVVKGAEPPPKPGQFVCPLPDFRTFVKSSGGLTEGDNPETEKKAMQRTLHSLRDKQFIRVYEDHAWLGDKGDKWGHL